MTIHKYLKCISIFALLSVGACDFADVQKNKNWELLGNANRNQGESRTAGGGLGWVMMSMAPRKDAVLEPLMQAVAEEETMEASLAEPDKSMMGLRISKYVSTEYDSAVDFFSINPTKKEREHLLNQRPEVTITKEYDDDTASARDAIESIPESEMQAQAVVYEDDKAVDASPQVEKIKKADSIFRKFAVSKK